jgi:mycothiol system anti-sigma-R factor
MSDSCEEFLRELYLYLDGELDDGARVQVEMHLRQCSPCLEKFDFEAELRKVISDRCSERVPDSLRLRIIALLDGM